VNEEDFNTVKEEIRKNLSSCLSLTLTSGNIRTRRGLQHFSFLKFSDKKLQKIYDLIFSQALQAEGKCPGSGIRFLQLVSGTSSGTLSSIPKNREDVISILRSLNLDTKNLNILEEVVRICNSTSKIAIKKSSSQKSYVELTEGYSFDLKPLLSLGSYSLDNPKVLCVDGYIESVSEVHHLLTSLVETKSPCLLFCRGMTDEVTHTLKVNIDRKTVLTYPYVVPYDLDNVNTLVDIAVVSNTDVVSSTKGDLISSSGIEDLGRVDSCTASGGLMTFKSQESASRVRNHVSNLKKSLEEKPESAEFISRRIRSLSSSCIDISIPDDMNFYSSSQQLDEGIRVISSIMNNLYDPETISRNHFISFQEMIKNTSLCLL